MSRSVIAIILLLGVFYSHSQPVHDREFDWTTFESCQLPNPSESLFSVVEIAPAVASTRKSQFETLLSDLVESLELSNNQSGTIKIKLLFLKSGVLCIRAIGTNGVALSVDQTEIIQLRLSEYDKCKPCQQRGIIQNCQGLVFLTVESGNLVGTRLANFNFTM